MPGSTKHKGFYCAPSSPSSHSAFQGSASKWATLYLALFKTEGRLLVQQDMPSTHQSLFQAWGRCLSWSPPWRCRRTRLQDRSSLKSQHPQCIFSTSCVPHLPKGSRAEKVTTSMLKVQKNLRSSAEKIRRHHEDLQHPWPCKSRDLLSQPNHGPKIQGKAGDQGDTVCGHGTKPLLPAGRP